jgi:hypothetical protein
MAVEPAIVVKSVAIMEAVAVIEAVATARSTTVETTAARVRTVVHLRVSGSDTSKNRARRDTCYCEFSH